MTLVQIVHVATARVSFAVLEAVLVTVPSANRCPHGHLARSLTQQGQGPSASRPKLSCRCSTRAMPTSSPSALPLVHVPLWLLNQPRVPLAPFKSLFKVQVWDDEDDWTSDSEQPNGPSRFSEARQRTTAQASSPAASRAFDVVRSTAALSKSAKKDASQGSEHIHQKTVSTKCAQQ